MSSQALLEVELYVFASNSGRFLLTPHEFDVDLDGDTYAGLSIERNALALGAEAAKSALELRLPPDCALVRHLLDASLTGETTSVTLRIARRDTWSDYWWLSGTRWMGRVLGVEISDDNARLRCESAQISLKRIGLRRLYSRKCSHVLYSDACGASPLSGTETVASIDGRFVTTNHIPSAVYGALAGGWLETTSGRRYMITREEEDVGVELLSVPSDLNPGDAVTLVAGCDHSTATCSGRFGNLDNYGGFPAIPSKNPFSTGVF